MKMIAFLFMLTGVLSSGMAQNWEFGQYDQYDFKSFQQYVPAQQAINLQKIDYPLLQAALFYETNRYRQNAGLTAFKPSLQLIKAAQGHASDMVKKDFYSHTSPLKGKKNMADRLGLVGLKNLNAAENIAITHALQLKSNQPYIAPKQKGEVFLYPDKTEVKARTYLAFAAEQVKNWINSPVHKENIMNPLYLFLGCGSFLEENQPLKRPPMFRSVQNFSSKADQ